VGPTTADFLPKAKAEGSAGSRAGPGQFFLLHSAAVLLKFPLSNAVPGATVAVPKAKSDATAVARTQRELAEMAAAEATGEELRLPDAELDASRVALASSDAKLRLALEAARMATWEWDVETDAVLGSVGREALYGRTPGTLPTRAAVLAAVHPEDRMRAEATIFRAMHRQPGEEEFDAVEFRIITPDGRIRWLRSQGRVTERDPATGRPLRAAGVTFDITERRQAEAEAEQTRAAIHAIYESVPVGLGLIDRQGRVVCMNARLGAILGMPAGEQAGRRLREILPAAVVEPMEKAHRRVIAEARPVTGLELVCETEAGPGDFRYWVANFQPIRREPEGKGEAVAASLMLEDVTDRRRAEARRDLLAREVDHRAKNALAVVQAAVRLTRAEHPADFARAVEGRIAAVARAQTLLAESHWKGADLCALLEGALSAFLGTAEGAGERVRLDGPAVTLAPAAAQPLSMAVHELATNATKYGALSAPGGQLSVTWRIDAEAGLLRLRWEEAGGPRIEAAPARRGFGSRVIDATIRDQLGGTVRRHWKRAGLVCDLALPLARSLARGAGPARARAAAAPPAAARSRPAKPGADPPAATRADR